MPPPPGLEFKGLHHLTAITADAPANLDFYTRVLGLRLMKKTVNQDDVSAYHLFYGDKVGSPGTEMTFFDWAQLPQRVPGVGTIAPVALRVNGTEALDWWADRLLALGVPIGDRAEHHGRAAFRFDDPEGQQLLLVDDEGAEAGPPWDGSDVPTEYAIRGLDSVTLTVRRLDYTAWMLTDILGFRIVGRSPNANDAGEEAIVFATGPGGSGAEVHVVVQPNGQPGQQGAGGVHHVAFRVPDDDALAAWQTHLTSSRVSATPVIDRFYFRSVYFREPGGCLFELATDGPGFATDEDADHIGERLALPPFLESRRTEIELGLKPL